MKIIALLLGTLIVGCSNSVITEKDKELQKEAAGIFEIIPTDLIDTNKETAKIALGKKLYFETRLSKNNKISCNSCHKLDNFGVDNEATSPGHDGTRGDRNSPTVYNAALNMAQFWDGRAKNLVEQVKDI